MTNWYYTQAQKGHHGAGREPQIQEAFIFAQDIVIALDVYKRLPSIKKRRIPLLMERISQERIQELEREIISGGFNIQKITLQGWYLRPS